MLRYHIQQKWTYLDKNSLEAETGIVKSKYKVFYCIHSIFNEIYIFYPTTSKQYFDTNRCVEIKTNDWEHRIEPYLELTSYIDICNPCSENRADLIEKTITKKEFHCVAKIPDNKFYEVIVKLDRFKKTPNKKYEHNQNILSEIISAHNDKLQELGLAG